MKYRVCLLVLVLLAAVNLPAQFYKQTGVEFETGYVFKGYSDVRIPGDTGDLFSLTEDLEARVRPFLRIRILQPLGEKHNISLLYAPLSIRSRGTLERNINFAGTEFPAGTDVSAKYRFDSYRLTYRYDFVKKSNLVFGMGLTAKIRDAGIYMYSDELYGRKTNIGFVPIVNFRLYRDIDERFAFLLEGDALAAPQGRAEDVQLAGIYKYSQHWKFKLGYRVLEGGANNDEVYNFAWISKIMLGVEINQ
jgi:hypothetical protein